MEYLPFCTQTLFPNPSWETFSCWPFSPNFSLFQLSSARHHTGQPVCVSAGESQSDESFRLFLYWGNCSAAQILEYPFCRCGYSNCFWRLKSTGVTNILKKSMIFSVWIIAFPQKPAFVDLPLISCESLNSY